MKKTIKETAKNKGKTEPEAATRFGLGSVVNHIKKSWVDIKSIPKRFSGFSPKGL